MTAAAKQLPSARALPPAAADRVQSIHRAGGQPLATPLRAWFEPRFGHDLSRVRTHVGASAAQAARGVDARAFTRGQDIVFGAGAYAPHTPGGIALIAHELAHTLQQDSSAPAPAEVLRRAPAGSAHERTADRIAGDALAGRPTARPIAAPADLVQCAEHGTYVSTHGTAAYLDAGAAFYRSWGHPNVRRVANVEEVLTDLDRARGPIDTFRLVSHGNMLGMQLGLMPDIQPSHLSSATTAYTTEARFRQDFTRMRMLSETGIAGLLTELRRDQQAAAALTTLGAASGVPAAGTDLGIVLRAMLEARFLDAVRLPPTASNPNPGAPNIPDRAVLDDFNRRRLQAYRPLVTAGFPAASRPAAAAALTSLAARIRATLGSASFSTLAQADADVMAAPWTDTTGAQPRLKPELARAITEGAGGPFLRRLRSVRGKVNANTHIEIRGCNVGTSTSYLDDVRGLFGAPGALPSISAPDLFQYFFALNFTAFGTNAAEQASLDAGATAVRSEFDISARLRAGDLTRVALAGTMAQLRTRYSLTPTVAELDALNPQLTPGARLAAGTVVFLRPRRIPAGPVTDLSVLVGQHLGNAYLWPRVWAWNPHIADASRLQPADQVWLVPPAQQRPPIASAERTDADVRASIRGGTAVVGQDTTDPNRPMMLLDNRQRAAAVGAWLATQQFDPRGRTARALSRLFAGGGAAFTRRMQGTYMQFLSRSYPDVVDPIFPDDPRYRSHIIRRP